MWIRSAIAGLMASGAVAQSHPLDHGYSFWNSDLPITQEALRQLVTGREIAFGTGGVAHFAADGAYTFSPTGGSVVTGRWAIMGDSMICITFTGGGERCDIWMDGIEGLVLLTETGARIAILPD